MSVKRLCIDIDNVIARTDVVLRQVIRDFTDGAVDLAYQDVVEFDYCLCSDSTGRGITKDDWNSIHYGWFPRVEYQSRIDSMEGAIVAIQELAEIFEIHFATARPAVLREQTVAWLAQRGLEMFDLHFLRQGEKHSTLGRFYASVEDNLDQAIAFANSGMSVSYVLAHPWNSSYSPRDNLVRLSTWEEIAIDLKSRVKNAHDCRATPAHS